MSYSTPYGMMELGSDGFPIIDNFLFDRIMDKYGWNVRKRRASLVKDCPCFDPIGNSANPDCVFCQGTGNLLGWQDEIVRGVLLFKSPKGGWGIGDHRAIGGEVERVQVMGFFSGTVDIKMNDLIVLNQASPTNPEDQIEFRVDSLMPRVVGGGRGNYVVIYYRADMRKVEYPVAESFA